MRPRNGLPASGVLVIATSAMAQVWCPASGWPGVPARVGGATAYDPDGAGPMAQTFVVALGDKASATDALLYRWDGAAWIGLDRGADRTPVPSLVRSLTAMSDGRLVVNGVASWTSDGWQPVAPLMPAGLNGVATALHPDGRLVVLSDDRRLWTLQGTTWNLIPDIQWNLAPFLTPPVGVGTTMTIAPNGDIWTAGIDEPVYFPGEDLIGYRPLAARWDGQTWNLVPIADAAYSSYYVATIVAGPDGSLYVSGRLSNSGFSIRRIGGEFLAESGPSSNVHVFVTQSGDIYASELRATSGSGIGGLRRWNGTTWTEVPGAAQTIGLYTPRFASIGSTLLAAGAFPNIDGGSRFYRNTAIYTSSCENVCDTIDFNGNQVFPEDQDVIDFFAALSGASCAGCNDIDYNNNGVFPEDQDVIDFFNVLSGGTCVSE